MEDFTASNSFTRMPRTSAISGVWKAPAKLKMLHCKAVTFALLSKVSIADKLPPTEKAREKRQQAIWQVSPFPAQLLQSFSTSSLTRPTTRHMACALDPGRAPDISKSMASALAFSTRSPVSKSKTPAAARALNSPQERPATAWHRSTLSGSSSLSFSRAARFATYIAGWQNFVWASFSAGPLSMMSSRSYPRTFFAVSSISLTVGKSLSERSMPTD
mmetsp:Transcript_96417/g.171410  ORF Transcript_96417/g.171410 Transcript_96417/m.171410 type:complete len:217 (+) Transcript_96417:307-957(+)